MIPRLLPTKFRRLWAAATHRQCFAGVKMKPVFTPATNTVIREEQCGDQPAIRVVNEAAFGRPDEADLVEALRAEGVVLLSLVVEAEGCIAGHILFSRMSIETPLRSIAAVSLAPMAVLPDFKRRGLGSKLIEDGLSRLRNRGEAIVIVLGHKDYYPRFGFSVARARELESPFPPDSYMALELSDGALKGVSGRVKYAAAFGL